MLHDMIDYIYLDMTQYTSLSISHIFIAQPGCQGFGLASPSVLLIDNMPSQILQVFLVNIIM